MQNESSEDGPIAKVPRILDLAVASILVLVFLVPRMKEAYFIEVNRCSLVDEEITAKMKYVFPSGSRHEIKRTYRCSFGEHYVYY